MVSPDLLDILSFQESKKEKDTQGNEVDRKRYAFVECNGVLFCRVTYMKNNDASVILAKDAPDFALWKDVLEKRSKEGIQIGELTIPMPESLEEDSISPGGQNVVFNGRDDHNNENNPYDNSADIPDNDSNTAHDAQVKMQTDWSGSIISWGL